MATRTASSSPAQVQRPAKRSAQVPPPPPPGGPPMPVAPPPPPSVAAASASARSNEKIPSTRDPPHKAARPRTATPAGPKIVIDDRAGPIVPLRIVAISDTHERHRDLTNAATSLTKGEDHLPPGDVLVHCGDILRSSRRLSEADALAAVDDFNDWLGTIKSRFPHGILVIAGNHDYWLERFGKERVQALLSNATYLEYTGVVIQGVSFFGCPKSWGHSSNRAFQDEAPNVDVAVRIPEYVDVLISHASIAWPEWKRALNSGARMSHTRQYGVRSSNEQVGRILKHVIRCRLNLCGHDHDHYGSYIQTVLPALPGGVCLHAGIQPVAHPLLPLPQVRNIGPIRFAEAFHRPLRDRRIGECVPSALQSLLPSQPDVVKHCVQALVRNSRHLEGLWDASVSPNDVPQAVRDAVRIEHVLRRRSDDSLPGSSGATLSPERAEHLSNAPVRFDTVSVVCSSLNMSYRLSHKPVEIDMYATPTTAALP